MQLHVNYIDNFQTKALDAIRELSIEAERVDIAVAFLSYRGWIELKPCLSALVSRAVEELFHLENTQVAFGLTDITFHPKDYLFCSNKGKCLTVLTSSADATYPGLTHNDEGGAIITRTDVLADDAAKKAMTKGYVKMNTDGLKSVLPTENLSKKNLCSIMT